MLSGNVSFSRPLFINVIAHAGGRMITNRRTVQVNQNCMAALAQFVLKAAHDARLEGQFRIYSSDLGAHNILAYEIDFEDLVDYDRFWRNWASGASPEFFKEYESMIERDLTNEVWDRVNS
jgi:hypothetical protein